MKKLTKKQAYEMILSLENEIPKEKYDSLVKFFYEKPKILKSSTPDEVFHAYTENETDDLMYVEGDKRKRFAVKDGYKVSSTRNSIILLRTDLTDGIYFNDSEQINEYCNFTLKPILSDEGYTELNVKIPTEFTPEYTTIGEYKYDTKVLKKYVSQIFSGQQYKIYVNDIGALKIENWDIKFIISGVKNEIYVS